MLDKLLSIALLLFSAQTTADTATNVANSDGCYIKVDGCSTPGNLPFFYKTKFTPACNKHDVCYTCVSHEFVVITTREKH